MSMIDSGGVRRPDIDPPRVARRAFLSSLPLLAAVPATAPGADDRPHPFEPTDPYRDYNLKGVRDDGRPISHNYASVGECAFNALLLGPGRYTVGDEFGDCSPWRFRITEAAYRDALSAISGLLARHFAEMPRHLPEASAMTDPA